jgi:uncharacterized RDD family membrane protein YckC
MEFNVDGADRATGQERRVTITAFDVADAQRQAVAIGLLVSRIWPAAGEGTDQVWTVHDSGRQFGPHSQQEVAAMLAAGQITPQALVWRVGMAQWASVSTIATIPQAAAPAYQPPNYGGPAQQFYAGTVQYAGFWLRFVASIIDGFVLVIPNLILHMFCGPFGFFLSIAVGWLYFALMESSEQQATLGKMALGLRVTDMNGNRISFGHATGRHFAKILSFLTLLVGYMMAGFTPRKQALTT